MAKNKAKMNKFVTGAITATMVASAVAPVAALADESTSKFTDISSYAQETQDKINALVDAGIINGTSDTTFAPGTHITRGQVVKLLGRYLVESGIAEVPADWDSKDRFTDVSVDLDEDLVKNAAVVFDAGVFQGNNGVLNSKGEITRENMALVLDRAAEAITGLTLVELAEGQENNVKDLDKAKDEAKEAIKALNALGLSTVENFNPKASVKRVHFATFLFNAIEVIEKVTVEAGIESVNAVNKTTVEVKLNQTVDSVKAGNFTIEGASVTAATLGEDKKTVTLTVSGLNYDKEYTVVAKDVEVDGDKVDFGSKTFSTPAIADLYELVIETKDATLKADGADNTEVTFKLLNAAGEVDLDADNLVLDLSTTFGTFAQKRVTIQDGQATVLLTSEFSNADVTAKIDAQIIEASGDYKELIGKVVGTQNITFVTSDVDNVNTVTLVSAEANQADRATLFFDKDVSIKHFVKTNTSGELLFHVEGLTGEYTADQVKIMAEATPEKISHILKNNSVEINQPKHDGNYKVKGIKPVAGNTKAVEVVLDKSTPLVDNADVAVTVNTENSLNKVTKSEVDFKVTDARVPSATGVSVEGLTTLKIKYSEPIVDSTLGIDGRHSGERAAHVSEITQDALDASSKDFLYAFGDFNPATQEDQRDVATLVLTKNYKEDFTGAIGGYFGAGKHSVQVASTEDFAYATDKNNIGTTQNLNFTIAEDKAKPTAAVTVESPEQFRVKFDKMTNLSAADFKALFTAGHANVMIYDEEAGEYVKASEEPGYGLQNDHLEFTRVSASEFVIELNTDWTEIYNTNGTTKNYYNDKYSIVINKDQVTNVANGLKNDRFGLELNYSGSLLNVADVTSPTIDKIERIGSLNRFDVTMSEPVKLIVNGDHKDTADTKADLNTPAQNQGTQASTSVQFLGTDKDGNAVTFDGQVTGYADATTTKADQVLAAHWTTKYFKVDTDSGKQTAATSGEALDANGNLNTNYIALTPQDIVDQGGNAEWTIVVRAIADDVGNTAASATHKFNIEKSKATNTPFFIDINKKADGSFDHYKVFGKDNGTDRDTVEITFSEGVQWTGTDDATNPGQYTLNGETLPSGTVITVSDDRTATHATQAGYEKVTISLPDGTLNTDTGSSNVITVNKNLVSYDGSVLEGATEVVINLKDDSWTPPVDPPLVDENTIAGYDGKVVLDPVTQRYIVRVPVASLDANVESLKITVNGTEHTLTVPAGKDYFEARGINANAEADVEQAVVTVVKAEVKTITSADGKVVLDPVTQRYIVRVPVASFPEGTTALEATIEDTLYTFDSVAGKDYFEARGIKAADISTVEAAELIAKK